MLCCVAYGDLIILVDLVRLMFMFDAFVQNSVQNYPSILKQCVALGTSGIPKGFEFLLSFKAICKLFEAYRDIVEIVQRKKSFIVEALFLLRCFCFGLRLAGIIECIPIERIVLCLKPLP